MIAKSRASEKLEELQKLKSGWKRDTKHLKGTDAIADREKRQTEKKLRIYEQYKRGKMDKDTYISEMKDVTSKLEELRGTLTEIEKRKTTGEYNLNASIEVEKKLKAVVDLDSFDSDTLKLILDRVLIKADGTEKYIWKDFGIV